MEYGLGSGRGQSLHICTGRIGGVHNTSAKFVPKPKRALDLGFGRDYCDCAEFVGYLFDQLI